MAVTTQLIGKLGGGGALEVKEQYIYVFSPPGQNYPLPSGWKKASATFKGSANRINPIIFDDIFWDVKDGAKINGGGGRYRLHALLRCLRHDHVGAPGIAPGVVV